jgi:hypothetical protein|tara:strand:- start:355 stop:744 length:390 start_codon:yes stop_codon:yes gene_type:complete
MNNIILKAKIVLSQLFDIPIYNFEDNISRKREVVEARRFLVFYLRDIFKLEYTKIVKHIPALTNHATAIYHYNLMLNFLKNEDLTQKKYNIFITKLTESSDLDIEKTMLELILERKNLNKKINELRKIL